MPECHEFVDTLSYTSMADYTSTCSDTGVKSAFTHERTRNGKDDLH